MFKTTQLLSHLATTIEERVAQLEQLAYFDAKSKTLLTQNVSHFSLFSI